MRTITERLERIPTGIPGFDKLVEGGLEKGTINLVMGGIGSGKSIFSMQYIVQGILQHGEPGVFISFEEDKEIMSKHMIEFGWDLIDYEDKGYFRYIKLSPEQMKEIVEQGGGAIEAAIEEIGAKRLVIDCITAFSMLFKEEVTKREALITLFEMIDRWKTTTMIVAEQDPTLQDFTLNMEEFEVNGVIALYNDKEKDFRKRTLEVLKMRGTNFEERVHPFVISNNGINVGY